MDFLRVWWAGFKAILVIVAIIAAIIGIGALVTKFPIILGIVVMIALPFLLGLLVGDDDSSVM